jgi:Right handed beta helix region
VSRCLFAFGAAVRACVLVVSGASCFRPVRVRRVTGLSVGLVAFLVLAFAQSAHATNVSGTISSNTTWTAAGSPYVMTGNVTVNSGVTLTIEPGVVVKLNAQLRSLTVNGTLSAVGTSAAPIVFTSVQDDTVGGDSNGDGSTTEPAPGQWYNLSFSSTSGSSELDYIEVRYGGYGSTASGYGAISIGSVALTIENSTIRDSQRSGIKVAAGGDLTLRRSTIAGGENGLSVNMGAVSVEHSTILENSEDGIWLNLTSTYAGAASSITDSDIKRNDENGIELLVDRTLPTAKWPHGSGNNIFNNAGGEQLKLSGYHPASTPQYDVDWTGNFWGLDVYFWYAPSLCLGTAPNSEGHLAYEWSDPEPGPGGVNTPPEGPISYNTYYAGSGGNIAGCAYDRFPIGPEDFSLEYISTAGRVPLGDAVVD